MLLIKEEGLLGIGYGQFINHSNSYARKVFNANKHLLKFNQYAHNGFLTALIEFGLLGFFIYLIINIYPVIETLIVFKSNRKDYFSYFILIIPFSISIYRLVHDINGTLFNYFLITIALVYNSLMKEKDKYSVNIKRHI